MKAQLIRFSLILILLEFMLNTFGSAQTSTYIKGTISEEPIILDQTNIPWAGYWPDGKLCFLPETDGSGWVCYWGEGDTFRTKAATTHLEDHIANNNWQRVMGKSVNQIDGFNDGGSWIIGIHRLDDGKLVGFFHAESWWSFGDGAHKSIGVTYSTDNGLTWEPGKCILASSYPKPQEAAWTGLGDGCVVWNEERKQYICYFQEVEAGGMCMAASSDPEGTAGTWKKWDGKDFTIEGCNQETLTGGKGVMIKNIDIVPGSSPSVMWNEYLNCWMMTYAKWGGDVYLSHSKDGIEWSKPILLLTEPIKPLYPNLVSDNGDVIGGMNLRLYYSRNQGKYGIRELAYRTINIMGLATLDDTFTAEVPCGDGTANLTFKVTNAMPLEVEVFGSPEGITGALTIPATVTDENGIEYAVKSIGEDAFRGRALTSVVLPAGIRTINSDAFRESGLESITFPTTMTAVGHSAFQDCKQLGSIDFNHCPACFEYDCFLGCSNLKELYIPNTVQFRNGDNSWAWNIFGSCTSLKTVTFEAFEEGQSRWSTTSLFPDCSALETVVLPSLSVMQKGFFWNSKNLKDVTILDIEDNFDARYNSFSKMFSGLNAEDILFHVPAGTAEIMLKAGYMNLSDKSGLPIVRTEFESEAARIATMADALNDGDKASLTTAIANARTAVNAAEDYATLYAQIDAIKTAAKTFLTTATVPANFDITAVIINPDFEQLERGWKLPVEWVNYPNVNKRGWNGASYENGEVAIGKFIDTWESTTLQDGDISQTITSLPAGIYRLEADIIATNQNDANAEVTGVSLFAGSQKTAVATKNEKPQHFGIKFTLDETCNCTIGINVNNTNANWVAIDNVKLYCEELQKDQNTTSISLDKPSLTFTAKNQTATLTVTVLPSNATNKSVTWTSSNTAVATVDVNGKVTAVSNGTATITATTNDGSNKSASCTVTVEINEETEIEISNWKNDAIAENTPVTSYTDESLDNYDWVLFSPEVRANGALQIVDGKLTTNSGTVYAIDPSKKNALVMRTANSPQTLNFTTPVKCGKIYFIAISSEGTSTLEAVVNYDDGSKESAKQYSVSDWYSTQSDQGEVIYGLDRINRSSNEFAEVNYFRIFEYLLPTNSSKKVKSITFTNISSAIPTILGVTTADKTVETHVVTYEVLYDGKLVATATKKVANGSVLPEPPTSLTNSYVTLIKYGTHPTTVTKDITVQFAATWNGPFELSKDEATAKWYNMHIHSGWYVGKQNSEPYYPTDNAGDALNTKEYQWAFGGDPYHIKVYNRTTGFAETLSKDGENAVMRSGDYSWDILPNSDGFVLRETGTDYNCINQFGGYGGPLKFWYNGNSPTDDGSTFRVEAVQLLDGDVNNDGKVNGADIVSVINYVLDDNILGDVNGDGRVNGADIVAVINYVLDFNGVREYVHRISSIEENRNKETAEMNATITTEGVNLNLMGGESFTAFQLTLTLPDGVSLNGVEGNILRLGNHELLFHKRKDGKYLVLGYAADNSCIEGDTGQFLMLQISGRMIGTALLTDVLFFTPNAETKQLNDISIDLETGIIDNTIEVSKYNNYNNMFDISGRPVKSTHQYDLRTQNLRRGVYIRNGHKFIVK